MEVSIVTPTYNRGKFLYKLYESLVKQSCKNFKWIIIDDGSTDNTRQIVEEFICQDKIEIIYLKKQNGGKHTAINYILDRKELLQELVFFVDSDDYLSSNAIERILYFYETISDKEHYSGICFQRINIKNNKLMCDYFPKKIFDSDIFELIRKYRIYQDKAEVFFKKELIKYRFPMIEGEKFISEMYVWMELTRNKKMRFIYEGIYYCEYLDGGYTKNFNKLLKNNLKGSFIYYKKIFFERKFGYIFRLRALYRLIQIFIYKLLKNY